MVVGKGGARDASGARDPLPRIHTDIRGRQATRSIHFVMLIGFMVFVVVHFTLVTGFARNMSHIALGVDDTRLDGMVLGFIGIAAVLSWVAAHYISWCLPRALQHAEKALTQPVKMVTFDHQHRSGWGHLYSQNSSNWRNTAANFTGVIGKACG